MTTDKDHMEDDAALAGEYVLSLMGADERAAFDARLLAEPDLRRLVAEWEEHFADIATPLPHVLPSADLKGRITGQLFPSEPEPKSSLFQFFNARIGTVFAGLAALVIVGGILMYQGGFSTPDAPLHMAELSAEDQSLQVVAVLSAAGDEIEINRVAGAASEGRSLEVWLIAGSNAPVSLGVLPDTAQAKLVLPEALRSVFAGAVLAISDEPLGGSPTGAPTGAVLATGAVKTL